MAKAMTQTTTTRILLAACLFAVALFAGGLMLAGPQSPSEAQDARPGLAEAAPQAEPDAQPAATPAPPPDGPFVIKRILPISGPIKYGEWHWDDAGIEDGPIVITVDLDARVLSIFKGGYEIGAAAVLVGTQEKPTPLGVFPITQKKRHHISNLYGAPMPYMQRLTDDGISLHGSEVEWGYASHGCIGMPEPFAAKVFAQTDIGDKVIITRGKMVGLGDSLADS
jgi:lipoprotein-anchoring transpeptidase ErfK/SrfK